MVAYQQFVELSESGDSEERGYAAHLAAAAYANHTGPADEQAALYAAVIGFLDDTSVKVRAALAFGLLHAVHAPRTILLSLLQDAPVIARAVAQYSPALLDTDLLGLVAAADDAMLDAIAMREGLSAGLAEAVLARGNDDISLGLARRTDVALPATLLATLAATHGDRAAFRGALLARPDLPPMARLALVHKARRALADARLVKGAIAPTRLQRLLRNAQDEAVVAVAEAGQSPDVPDSVEALVTAGEINARLLLRALVEGKTAFVARCLATLAELPPAKVANLLQWGSRVALEALLKRAGLGAGIRTMLIRVLTCQRIARLGDDVAASHFVVMAVTEDLIAEHGGAIPPSLSEAFGYLCEQNITLARRAARGVMPAFAGGDAATAMLPEFVAEIDAPEIEPPLALDAA